VVNTTNVTDINQSVTPLTRNEILLATLQEAKQLMGENKSVLFIESNVTDSINLSWYFYDPENSTLKFAIIPLNMSNVSYNLTGEILSITPGDYIGIQTLQISAKDTLNATTTSPVIYLVVAPIQDALQGYFIAGFIVLLAIILIVSFDVWIMRRNYKKQLEMQKVIDPNKDAPIESTLPKSEDADKEVIDNTDSDKDDSKQPKNP
jgi:hypothetical protein